MRRIGSASPKCCVPFSTCGSSCKPRTVELSAEVIWMKSCNKQQSQQAQGPLDQAKNCRPLL